MRIRILLADDQAMVRAGFRMILEAESDLEVVGEADDGLTTITAADRLRPDLTLMDIQMPIAIGSDCLSSCARSRSRSPTGCSAAST